MSAINKYRVLTVVCTFIATVIFAAVVRWDLPWPWSMLVTGLGGAFAAVALLCYGQAMRLMK